MRYHQSISLDTLKSTAERELAEWRLSMRRRTMMITIMQSDCIY